MIDMIGWLSACVLLTTLIKQVIVQWRNRSDKGVSTWLFIGQITSSLGFVVYSILLNNVIFIITNSLLLLVAITGEAVFIRNRRLQNDKSGR